MSKRFSICVVTDVGQRRRRNEDAVDSDEELGLVLVADGMGGHPAGDVASRLAIEEALRVLRGGEPLSPDGTPEQSGETVGERMADAVVSADVRVRNEGVRDPTRQGMGTTLTVLHFDRESGDFTIGHVGDSRAYRFRNEELSPLTKDDTWVQAQVDAGRMTAEEARYHPWSSLLSQAVGLDQPAKPAVLTGTTEPGDVFLLCSDGLVTMLTDAEVEAVLQDHLTYGLGDVARTLVDVANSRGGIDNITVGILRVEADTA